MWTVRLHALHQRVVARCRLVQPRAPGGHDAEGEVAFSDALLIICFKFSDV